jgi:hypothetical protein
MNERRRKIVVFLAATVLSGTGAFAGRAYGWWSRESGLSCDLASNRNYITDGLSTQVFNISTNNFSGIVCAMLNTDVHPISGLTTLNVHGRVVDASHGSAGASAQACRQFWGSTGGECGVLASTTGTGDYILQPDTSAVKANAADFPYLHVFLGPGRATFLTSNSLRGYFVAGN